MKREEVNNTAFGKLLRGKDKALLSDLRLHEWNDRSIDDVYSRIRQIYSTRPTTFTQEESDIVKSKVQSFLQLKKWTKAQFAEWLSEDVQQHYARRESRQLCNEIAAKLPGRNTLSVTRHLLNQYRVEQLLTTWSPADDAMLKKLVSQKGKQWKVIAAEMGRDAQLVRMRYRDYVSLGKNRATGPWTVQDMERLYKGVLELLKETDWRESEGLHVDVIGRYIDWNSVSQKVGDRNRLQCLKKWMSLDYWRHHFDD